MIASRSLLAGTILFSLALPLPHAQSPAPLQDVIIPPGASVYLNTNDTRFVGSAGELVFVVDGHLLVNDFIVGDGAHIRVVGTHPLRVEALGKVIISGDIELPGFDAKNVSGIATAAFPEPGAPGGPGGGSGGDASALIDGSTPKGDRGVPGLGQRGGGGRGGETGYGGRGSRFQTQLADPMVRRGAGGAGGRFGPNAAATTPSSLSLTGLSAQDGGEGSSLATGAIFGLVPRGGRVGLSAFRDEDPDNDFWGVGLHPVTGELVVGELSGMGAGAGGGGGGDSVRSTVFPHPNFQNKTDDKGGAGGGGAGAIYISARGRIQLFNDATGVQGTITANGGKGANGQLVVFGAQFFVKSGGGGGGGSGGHIVLESGTEIDLGSGGEVLQARGGLGGVATQAGGVGRGGEGGPGVIQLHAPGGLQNIRSVLPLNEASVPAPATLLSRPGLR